MRLRSLPFPLTLMLTIAGCAETSGAVQSRGPRTSADDSDMWNVVNYMHTLQHK